MDSGGPKVSWTESFHGIDTDKEGKNGHKCPITSPLVTGLVTFTRISKELRVGVRERTIKQVTTSRTSSDTTTSLVSK